MKIIIEDGNYEFSCNFKEERPKVEDAVFSACYMLGKIYPISEVKKGMNEAFDDL